VVTWAVEVFITKHESKIGRIYKKWNTLPDGTRQDQSTWTVRYKGKDYATGATDAKEAEKFLTRLGDETAHGVRATQRIKELLRTARELRLAADEIDKVVGRLCALPKESVRI
jgi:hypothetical protein